MSVQGVSCFGEILRLIYLKRFSKHTLVCQGHLKVIKINKRRFINEYFGFILDDLFYEIVKLDFMLSVIAFVAR